MRIIWLFSVMTLAGCNMDPTVQVYSIKCTLAGVTVADGYAQRDGVVRQLWRDRDTGEVKKVTLLPGTECTRGPLLRQSEWREIQAEWNR
jgi:hypothetical protein